MKHFLYFLCLFDSDVKEDTESDFGEDGSILGKKYHIEFIGYQPTFYDISNDCEVSEAGTDIEVIVQEAHAEAKSNKTACQIEISNLKVMVTVANTLQEDAQQDHDANGATYIAQVQNKQKCYVPMS